MGWLFLIVLGILILGLITDRKGWTQTRGKGSRMTAAVMSGWEGVFRPGIQAAEEYRREVHDEEQPNGGRGPLVFTGVGDDEVQIQPAGPDEPDLAATPPEVDAVACVARVAGRPVANLSFWRADVAAGVFGMVRAHGEAVALDPALSRRIDRLLLAYLFEFEGASAVAIGDERITPETVEPREWPFHLLLPARGSGKA